MGINQVVKKQEDIEKLIRQQAIKDGRRIPKKDIKYIVNQFWDKLCGELEVGHSVKLHGKGVFYISERSERMGRNPNTGEYALIPKRQAMAFRVSTAYAKKFAEIRRDAESDFKPESE